MKIFIAVLLLVVLTGCSDKNKVPAGIIPPEKMKLVMYDMMRSSEFLSGFVLYKDTSVNKIGESLNWYKSNPKMMSGLMDSIMVIPTPPNLVPKTDSIKPVSSDSVKRADSSRLRLMRSRQMGKDSILRQRGPLPTP
jgi:hypothetical protein